MAHVIFTVSCRIFFFFLHVESIILVHRLSSPVACRILVPRPGIEPASPELQGGFFTTGPGKSLEIFYSGKAL